MGASRAHHHRGDGRVIIQRVPIRELTRETVGTLDGLGGKGGRAIQGHQELIPENPKTVEQMVLCKAPKDLNKDRIKMARDDRIEEGTDVIVTGNLRDAKQGVGVKCLSKINFIFVSKILDHPFDILNKVRKVGICPEFDPFILHKTP